VRVPVAVGEAVEDGGGHAATERRWWDEVERMRCFARGGWAGWMAVKWVNEKIQGGVASAEVCESGRERERGSERKRRCRCHKGTTLVRKESGER
jgi:hypothetical protein